MNLTMNATSLTRKSQHSQECKDPCQQCIYDLGLLTKKWMGFQDWPCNMSTLMILAASVFKIACGKTDTQTNGGKKIPTPANTIGVGKKIKSHLKFVCDEEAGSLRFTGDVLLFVCSDSNGDTAVSYQRYPCVVWRGAMGRQYYRLHQPMQQAAAQRTCHRDPNHQRKPGWGFTFHFTFHFSATGCSSSRKKLVNFLICR